ncbi:MAG: DUF3127 domain-containing protein [Dysgonamonadaceae bacterium]|nr:DUF3127 domain-containing protein [Dysgonamonadaceae bacterium]
MQLTAKLVQVLPVETGMGRNGEWKKQSIILETDGQYPRKVCMTAWGDKISPAQLQTGNMLTIDFDIESREFNGRWYTDLKVWKVESAASEQYAAPVPPMPQMPPAPPVYHQPEAPVNYHYSESDMPAAGNIDDLPF